MAGALPYVSEALGAAGTIYNIYAARQAEKRLQAQLTTLGNQPLPTYSTDPTIQSQYQTQAGIASNPRGFTQGEAGAFQQSLARTLAARRYNATNLSGGNLSKAIGAMGVSDEINGINNYAVQDAQLRRNNQQAAYGRLLQLGNVFQGTRNANTQALLNRRLMQEQLLGESLRSQRDYQRNAIQGISSDLITGGTMGLYSQPRSNSSYTTWKRGLKFTPTDLKDVDPNDTPGL